MTPPSLPDELVQRLEQWIPRALAERKHELSSGYQGRVLFYDDGVRTLAIKTPSYSGLFGWIALWMLRREARAYQRLHGLNGIPVSYGLINDRYLVMEYIRGSNLRDACLEDRELFYRRLLSLILRMHARGVAHADLKRRDNIMVDEHNRPWLLDFGVAVVRGKRRSALNRWFYNTARQFDLNAWVKHKYRRRLDLATAADRRCLRRTWLETGSGRIKALWLSLTRRRVR